MKIPQVKVVASEETKQFIIDQASNDRNFLLKSIGDIHNRVGGEIAMNHEMFQYIVTETFVKDMAHLTTPQEVMNFTHAYFHTSDLSYLRGVLLRSLQVELVITESRLQLFGPLIESIDDNLEEAKDNKPVAKHLN